VTEGKGARGIGHTLKGGKRTARTPVVIKRVRKVGVIQSVTFRNKFSESDERACCITDDAFLKSSVHREEKGTGTEYRKLKKID